MKRALTTLLDDKFIICAEVFLKSFFHFNPWFSDDFIILDNGISDDNKDLLLSYYNGIRFNKINKKAYCDVNMSNTHQKLQATYYTLDIFNLTKYDRITFLDMDLVVMDNIKPIFEKNDKIVGCRAYHAPTDALVGTINTGVFTINDDAINKHVYLALIRKARRGYSMPDQKVLNSFFARDRTYMDKRYNVEKRMEHSKNHQQYYEEAKIFHYVATKPYEDKPNEIERSYEKTEKIWWYWHNQRRPNGPKMETKNERNDNTGMLEHTIS